MELKNCIILTLVEGRTKLCIPKSEIKGLGSTAKRSYGLTEDRVVTKVYVTLTFAESVGINLSFMNRGETVYCIEVEEELLKVMGMIGASVASEVLFK